MGTADQLSRFRCLSCSVAGRSDADVCPRTEHSHHRRRPLLEAASAGEPVQLTHDQNVKASPAFSYDGSRIAYSVPPAWDTWIVPVLGGKPRLILPNASGLTWIDDQHILFSEI